MSGGNQSELHQSLVSTIRDYLKVKGAWFLKYYAGGLGTLAGAPDFFAALPIPGIALAAFVAIEAKTGDATLNAAQRVVKADMERAGVLYIVATCIEDVDLALLEAGLVESPSFLYYQGSVQ